MKRVEDVAARRQLERIPVVESNGLFRDGPRGEHVTHHTGAVYIRLPGYDPRKHLYRARNVGRLTRRQADAFAAQDAPRDTSSTMRRNRSFSADGNCEDNSACRE
jgi:hypothetical protein